MAISINPQTYVITIPQADLTLISGTLYELDTDQFRLDLKDWEDSEEGIVQPKTHNHNTEYTIAGTTYARAVNILPPYSVEFEDGQYSVRLAGSNNNIWDVSNGILIQNQVQVIPQNSAGLVVSGSGVTQQDKDDITAGVWTESSALTGDFGTLLEEAFKLLGHKVTKSGDVLTIYEENGSTVWKQYNVASGGRVEV